MKAFSIQLSQEELLNVSSESAREVVHMELTLPEFADALSMASTSSFVTKVRLRGDVRLWKWYLNLGGHYPWLESI